MHDELTDIRDKQYENAVRQLENLEMQRRAEEAYEQLRTSSKTTENISIEIPQS